MAMITLKTALRQGRRVYGTSIVSTSPRWPGVIALLGLDFVFIDTEHMPIDRAQLSWMCHAYHGYGLSPLVRIPAVDPDAASMAIDAGAAGVVVPYLETANQLRALRGAVKLRPLKGGRVKRLAAGEEVLDGALRAYIEDTNRELVLIANIESVDALENLDDILVVPELDGVLIGPHDLSCSLSIPKAYDHPRFEDAVGTIIQKARGAGVAAGIHSWMGVEREVAWARLGLNLIIHSADIIAVRETLGAEVRELRDRLGDA